MGLSKFNQWIESFVSRTIQGEPLLDLKQELLVRLTDLGRAKGVQVPHMCALLQIPDMDVDLLLSSPEATTPIAAMLTGGRIRERLLQVARDQMTVWHPSLDEMKDPQSEQVVGSGSAALVGSFIAAPVLTQSAGEAPTVESIVLLANKEERALDNTDRDNVEDIALLLRYLDSLSRVKIAGDASCLAGLLSHLSDQFVAKDRLVRRLLAEGGIIVERNGVIIESNHQARQLLLAGLQMDEPDNLRGQPLRAIYQDWSASECVYSHLKNDEELDAKRRISPNAIIRRPFVYLKAIDEPTAVLVDLSVATAAGRSVTMIRPILQPDETAALNAVREALTNSREECLYGVVEAVYTFLSVAEHSAKDELAPTDIQIGILTWEEENPNGAPHGRGRLEPITFSRRFMESRDGRYQLDATNAYVHVNLYTQIGICRHAAETRYPAYWDRAKDCALEDKFIGSRKRGRPPFNSEYAVPILFVNESGVQEVVGILDFQSLASTITKKSQRFLGRVAEMLGNVVFNWRRLRAADRADAMTEAFTAYERELLGTHEIGPGSRKILEDMVKSENILRCLGVASGRLSSDDYKKQLVVSLFQRKGDSLTIIKESPHASRTSKSIASVNRPVFGGEGLRIDRITAAAEYFDRNVVYQHLTKAPRWEVPDPSYDRNNKPCLIGSQGHWAHYEAWFEPKGKMVSELAVSIQVGKEHQKRHYVLNFESTIPNFFDPVVVTALTRHCQACATILEGEARRDDLEKQALRSANQYYNVRENLHDDAHATRALIGDAEKVLQRLGSMDRWDERDPEPVSPAELDSLLKLVSNLRSQLQFMLMHAAYNTWQGVETANLQPVSVSKIRSVVEQNKQHWDNLVRFELDLGDSDEQIYGRLIKIAIGRMPYAPEVLVPYGSAGLFGIVSLLSSAIRNTVKHASKPERSLLRSDPDKNRLVFSLDFFDDKYPYDFGKLGLFGQRIIQHYGSRYVACRLRVRSIRAFSLGEVSAIAAALLDLKSFDEHYSPRRSDLGLLTSRQNTAFLRSALNDLDADHTRLLKTFTEAINRGNLELPEEPPILSFLVPLSSGASSIPGVACDDSLREKESGYLFFLRKGSQIEEIATRTDYERIVRSSVIPELLVVKSSPENFTHSELSVFPRVIVLGDKRTIREWGSFDRWTAVGSGRLPLEPNLIWRSWWRLAGVRPRVAIVGKKIDRDALRPYVATRMSEGTPLFVHDGVVTKWRDGGAAFRKRRVPDGVVVECISPDTPLRSWIESNWQGESLERYFGLLADAAQMKVVILDERYPDHAEAAFHDRPAASLFRGWTFREAWQQAGVTFIGINDFAEWIQDHAHRDWHDADVLMVHQGQLVGNLAATLGFNNDDEKLCKAIGEALKSISTPRPRFFVHTDNSDHRVSRRLDAYMFTSTQLEDLLKHGSKYELYLALNNAKRFPAPELRSDSNRRGDPLGA